MEWNVNFQKLTKSTLNKKRFLNKKYMVVDESTNNFHPEDSFSS